MAVKGVPSSSCSLITFRATSFPFTLEKRRNKKEKKSMKICSCYGSNWASQVALVVKNPPANAGDVKDTGLARSPGEGHGNPSSIFAWRIPWTEEPGRLQSMGSQSQKRLKGLSTHCSNRLHYNLYFMDLH